MVPSPSALSMSKVPPLVDSCSTKALRTDISTSCTKAYNFLLISICRITGFDKKRIFTSNLKFHARATVVNFTHNIWRARERRTGIFFCCINIKTSVFLRLIESGKVAKRCLGGPNLKCYSHSLRKKLKF